MWKNVTWAFGKRDRRLDWSVFNEEPLLSVQDASFVRVVQAADKREVRKSKSVSISWLRSVAVRSVSPPTPKTKPSSRPRLLRESWISQIYSYPV
jgi:hypothetical protein